MSGVSIDVEEVSRRYGRRWALSNVSFHVPAGSVVMVAGHNGAGKSTLVRVLATAIRPDRGRVMIGGFDTTTHREDVRKLTAILSHANYLYESLTARENLQVVADHMGGGGEIVPALEQVGLSARADDAVSTF